MVDKALRVEKLYEHRHQSRENMSLDKSRDSLLKVEFVYNYPCENFGGFLISVQYIKYQWWWLLMLILKWIAELKCKKLLPMTNLDFRGLLSVPSVPALALLLTSSFPLPLSSSPPSFLVFLTFCLFFSPFFSSFFSVSVSLPQWLFSVFLSVSQFLVSLSFVGSLIWKLNVLLSTSQMMK